VAEPDDISLNDKRLKKLERLIRESFRVRENRTPTYVDVSGNLDRVALRQHQIIFGRRGSGKSCLLVYYRHEIAPDEQVHSAYLLADTIKTLDYPDVLLRLLLAIFQGLPGRTFAQRWKARFRKKGDPVREVIAELKELLTLPSAAKLKVTTGSDSRATERAGASAKTNIAGAEVTAEQSAGQSREEVRESDEAKMRTIENRLADYKAVIQDRISESKFDFGTFIIDDFYLIDSEVQPDVIDYVHRLLRDTDLYFKVGTVRHRTRLLKTHLFHVGIQIQQDVDGFNLDQTLEDLDQTGTYLGTMLRELGKQVGIDDVCSTMSDEAEKDLVLLSG